MFEAFYDLSCSPPTYDIISFLGEVERERRIRGEDEVAVTFLPGPIGGFRADTLWPYTVAERQRMRDRVAKPICRLLPSVVSVEVAANRLSHPVDGFGAGRAVYGMYRQVNAMRDGIRPLRSPQPRYRPNSRLVTMTLRECEHWPERNSQVGDWVATARWLETDGWEVIVVRDTLTAREKLGECSTDALAAENISARARLYASAAVNMFISNGPAWLALALDVPVLMLRPTNDLLRGPFGSEAFKANGVDYGGQIPGAPDYQRLAWVDDTAENIMAAFHAYTADLHVEV